MPVDRRTVRWQMTVDCHPDQHVIENAMSLQLPLHCPSTFCLRPFTDPLMHRLNRSLIVPSTFSCVADVESVQLVVRVVQPANGDDVGSRMHSLASSSVLERDKAMILDQRLNEQLLLSEAGHSHLSSASVSLREIDTRPLQALDHLYRFSLIHEVCIDFKRHLSAEDMMSAANSLLSAGLQRAIVIPPHAVYLRGVRFRPQSLVFQQQASV